MGRPHGVAGAFVVVQPTARLELLDVGRYVLVDGREARIASRRGTRERPIVELEGGAPQPGAAIEVPRESVQLADGEYLVDDLIGCDVVDGERSLGVVTDVLVLPAADVLEVAGSVLVPLVGDAIRSIDPAARRIDVDSGFLDAD